MRTFVEVTTVEALCLFNQNTIFDNIYDNTMYYGTENYPSNFSIVSMNILVASFGSALSGSIYDATNSYVTIACAAIAAIVVGTAAACVMKEPEKH